MIKLHTRVFMDSGIEYIFDISRDAFLSKVIDTNGKLHNGFIHLTTKDEQKVSINPVHVSSIEEIEVNTEQRIGILK
ncbi:hypothetical protein [Tuberibacillus calidus]|uniref:hypothetical protein n=1 Tax=Tuberibacillus calidus TaxID=340097 RepID=UPI00041D2078|nr:hypothetical protein [Tuberibacillus calidus]